jgi:hypothetical protein
MEKWIKKAREGNATKNPMLRQGDWHGHKGVGPKTAKHTPRCTSATSGRPKRSRRRTNTPTRASIIPVMIEKSLITIWLRHRHAGDVA